MFAQVWVKDRSNPDRRYIALQTNEVLQAITDLEAAAEGWMLSAALEAMRKEMFHKGNLRMALDHIIGIRRGNGLRSLEVIETCFNAPCPWFGQGVNDTERLEKTLFRTWTVIS